MIEPAQQPTPRWSFLPNGVAYVANSNPDELCHGDGKPNVAAIARASYLDKGALNRIVRRQRQAGSDTVLRIARMTATARGITLDEALANIFTNADERVAA